MKFIIVDKKKCNIFFLHRFDGEKQEWIWKYPTEDGFHNLYMEKGNSLFSFSVLYAQIYRFIYFINLEEEIRFKVTSEIFLDTTPSDKPTDKLSEKPTSEASYKITVRHKKCEHV